MGGKCVVPNCKSGYKTCTEKVSLFKIPVESLCEWQKKIPRKDRDLTTRDHVCEKHFNPQDIIREISTVEFSYKLKYPKLAKGAVPCLFPNCKQIVEKTNPMPDQKTPLTTSACNASDLYNQTSSDSTSNTNRTLSEPHTTAEAKRLRLEVNDFITEDLQVSPNDEGSKLMAKPSKPIIARNAISEYMQKRTLKKLTREDLEQICLLKMCEAICHKSEIGELRNQLSVLEQMIDTSRKEAAQLTKQARDLEIVNKKLLGEVRLNNDKDKPLIPVKITRSVGLQVHLV